MKKVSLKLKKIIILKDSLIFNNILYRYDKHNLDESGKKRITSASVYIGKDSYGGFVYVNK